MLVVHTTKAPVVVLGRATWRLYSDSPCDGAIIFGDLIGNSTCYTQLIKSR